MKENRFKELEYNRRQHDYILVIILKSGKDFGFSVYAESKAELLKEAKDRIELVRGWGWCEEIDRVYATRYDCISAPERVRQAA